MSRARPGNPRRTSGGLAFAAGGLPPVLALLLTAISAATEPGSAGPAAAGPATLAIDTARSALDFSIHRRGETIEGHAHEFAGEVAFDAARPEDRPSVSLRVVAASLETGNRVRDHKMRGSHLEAERFPEITFRSTSIRLSAASPEAGPSGVSGPAPAAPASPLRPGESRRALVEGILGLHGVERTMLIPATIRYDNGSLTAEGEATLSLTDHSIPIPRFLWIVLDDEVKVRFRFVASPKGSG
jgi:polyisoprenoid-binding protein YceI